MSVSVPSDSLAWADGGAVPSDPIWRLRVEQYHEMIRSGILGEDDPVELLDGWLVPKMPKNPDHRIATGLVRDAVTVHGNRAVFLRWWRSMCAARCPGQHPAERTASCHAVKGAIKKC